MPNLARRLSLLLGKNGLVEKQINDAVDSQVKSVEEIVRIREMAGVSRAQIFAELQEDLLSEVPRIFGEFGGDMKRITYGAANIGASQGMASELDPQTKYRWQTAGGNVCPDCEGRHGEVDTMANWTLRGLPAQWGSLCQTNCQCTLVAEELELDIIKSE